MRSERLFFISVFAFSWSIWIPVAVASGTPGPLHDVAIGIGAAGPSLAGVACTARAEGRRGLRRLFGSLLSWRLGIRWYLLSLGGPIAVALVAVALHRVVAGGEVGFRLPANTILLVPPALVVGLLLGPLQEELGWRGFALPHLLERWTSVRASVVLGGVWAGWHLPLYALVGDAQPRPPLWLFLVSVVALSFIYTWFWTRTGGRLLVAVLLHSATNVAAVLLLRDAGSDFGPVVISTALTVLLAGAAAGDLRRGDRTRRRGPGGGGLGTDGTAGRSDTA